MPRQIEKKAFLFYASILDSIEELPPERQGKVALALIEYGLDDYHFFTDFSGSLSILNPIEKIIFHSIIYEIDVQKRRYYNKYLIHGAILSIHTVIGNHNDEYSLSALTDNERNTCIDLISILEEKYLYVTKHDNLDVLGELHTLLPIKVYDIFKRIYKPKSWVDNLEKLFEKRLEDESRNLSDDVKENIFAKLKTDYLETGVALERYEELIEQYTEYAEGSGFNET